MVLGTVADAADLEKIENDYSSARTDLERAEFVVALEKLEIGRRNAFYNRIKSDGELVRRAVASVRSGKKHLFEPIIDRDNQLRDGSFPFLK